MKKMGLLILVLVLLLTACGADKRKQRDNDDDEPAIRESSEEPEETRTEPEESQTEPEEMGILEGIWILESLEVEGQQLQADSEGIESTLEFYLLDDGMLCADYFYRVTWDEDSNRVMLAVPVFQYAPEAETESFSAWLDCSEYPYVFGESQGEEYNLYLEEDGDLRLQFVSYVGGDYGIYSVSYTYVRQDSTAGEIVLTADYAEESDHTNILEIDPVEAWGFPVSVQTNTALQSVKVVELAYSEETWELEVVGVLYDAGALTPTDQLILRLAFPGTIPNRGLQVTKDGITRTYAFSMSGYDGSILLYEVESE